MKLTEKIIWIGNRESEIKYTDLFYKSITIYGSNKNNNISYCQQKNYEDGITNFFVKTIDKELNQNKIKLFFYSYKLAEKVVAKAPYLKNLIINDYNVNVIRLLDNKTYAHLWASNFINTIEFTEMFGSECKYDNMHSLFNNYESFVIQKNCSSGGQGTFLLNKNNERQIHELINEEECYIVSPYYEQSYSVNTHVLISDDYVSTLPMSIQIIENVNNRLLYKGADFISAQSIPTDIKSKINCASKNLGNTLKSIGYRGILGIDFLICDTDLFFLEVNPRFQASSLLINKALKENSMPDLQTIVYKIFTKETMLNLLRDIENLKVHYSMLSFYQNTDISYNDYLLKSLKSGMKYVDCIIEENVDTTVVDEYMFRVIFSTNISSLNFDKKISVYQNLLNYSYYKSEVYSNNKILKCALLTQGVVVDPAIYTIIGEDDSIKNATFDAVDIICDDMFINCPTKTKFVELSPFKISRYKDSMALFYLNEYLCDVKISLQEKLPKTHTENNIYIHRIGYLTTDRLRIKHTSCCRFKREINGCKFCHITSTFENDFQLNDIYETIDTYISSVDFRHFLIGGPSNDYSKESKLISEIIKYIREKSDKPIYIMSLPPKDNEIIKEYYELGANEIAFNIEIFNRELAEKFMPGKGKIPLKQYENALKESSKYFGVENTRSMLLIGLDSQQSILDGIKFLCDIGVTPMISPFRAMYHTELSNYVPPTIGYIYDTFLKAKTICDDYGITLGPKCKFCQNNTLV